MNGKNLTLIIVSIGLLFSGIGIGYYYGIYLPKNSTTIINNENIIQVTKETNCDITVEEIKKENTCIDNTCSGHMTGYKWACEKHKNSKLYGCDGKSLSFVNGCLFFAKKHHLHFGENKESYMRCTRHIDMKNMDDEKWKIYHECLDYIPELYTIVTTEEHKNSTEENIKPSTYPTCILALMKQGKKEAIKTPISYEEFMNRYSEKIQKCADDYDEEINKKYSEAFDRVFESDGINVVDNIGDNVDECFDYAYLNIANAVYSKFVKNIDFDKLNTIDQSQKEEMKNFIKNKMKHLSKQCISEYYSK